MPLLGGARAAPDRKARDARQHRVVAAQRPVIDRMMRVSAGIALSRASASAIRASHHARRVANGCGLSKRSSAARTPVLFRPRDRICLRDMVRAERVVIEAEDRHDRRPRPGAGPDDERVFRRQHAVGCGRCRRDARSARRHDARRPATPASRGRDCRRSRRAARTAARACGGRSRGAPVTRRCRRQRSASRPGIGSSASTPARLAS